MSADLGAQNTFCAGGRYDSLIKEVGGKSDAPSVGAAIGVERLLLLLEPLQSSYQLPRKKSLHALIPLEEEQTPLALMIADHVRSQDIALVTFFDGSLKSRMRKADKWDVRTVLLVGATEQENGTVTVKCLQTGATNTVAQVELTDFLKKIS